MSEWCEHKKFIRSLFLPWSMELDRSEKERKTDCPWCPHPEPKKSWRDGLDNEIKSLFCFYNGNPPLEKVTDLAISEVQKKIEELRLMAWGETWNEAINRLSKELGQ